MKIENLKNKARENACFFFKLAIVSGIIKYFIYLIPVEPMPAFINLIVAIVLMPVSLLLYVSGVLSVLNFLLYAVMLIVAKIKRHSMKTAG